jgi:hypothetical protein
MSSSYSLWGRKRNLVLTIAEIIDCITTCCIQTVFRWRFTPTGKHDRYAGGINFD